MANRNVSYNNSAVVLVVPPSSRLFLTLPGAEGETQLSSGALPRHVTALP